VPRSQSARKKELADRAQARQAELDWQREERERNRRGFLLDEIEEIENILDFLRNIYPDLITPVVISDLETRKSELEAIIWGRVKGNSP
jgi:predicted AAA+ superfamily ATPase